MMNDMNPRSPSHGHYYFPLHTSSLADVSVPSDTYSSGLGSRSNHRPSSLASRWRWFWSCHRVPKNLRDDLTDGTYVYCYGGVSSNLIFTFIPGLRRHHRHLFLLICISINFTTSYLQRAGPTSSEQQAPSARHPILIVFGFSSRKRWYCWHWHTNSNF